MNLEKVTFEVPNHLLVEPSKSAIYGILNLINGKIYIGSAVEVLNRLRTHKARLNLNKHPSKHLQGAWNEYSGLAFEFVILEYVNDKADLIEREEIWIELMDATNPKCGYNKRKIPTSNLGLKLGPASDARKKRMSELFTGRKYSAEAIENMAAAQRGKKYSAETRAKVSAAGRRPSSDEKKLKISLAHKAKSSWPHERGYLCNCRECLDRKNLIRRLRSYNHEEVYSND
jgi:group I intron endonuclease